MTAQLLHTSSAAAPRDAPPSAAVSRVGATAAAPGCAPAARAPLGRAASRCLPTPALHSRAGRGWALQGGSRHVKRAGRVGTRDPAAWGSALGQAHPAQIQEHAAWGSALGQAHPAQAHTSEGRHPRASRLGICTSKQTLPKPKPMHPPFVICTTQSSSRSASRKSSRARTRAGPPVSPLVCRHGASPAGWEVREPGGRHRRLMATMAILLGLQLATLNTARARKPLTPPPPSPHRQLPKVALQRLGGVADNVPQHLTGPRITGLLSREGPAKVNQHLGTRTGKGCSALRDSASEEACCPGGRQGQALASRNAAVADARCARAQAQRTRISVSSCSVRQPWRVAARAGAFCTSSYPICGSGAGREGRQSGEAISHRLRLPGKRLAHTCAPRSQPSPPRPAQPARHNWQYNTLPPWLPTHLAGVHSRQAALQQLRHLWAQVLVPRTLHRAEHHSGVQGVSREQLALLSSPQQQLPSGHIRCTPSGRMCCRAPLPCAIASRPTCCSERLCWCRWPHRRTMLAVARSAAPALSQLAATDCGMHRRRTAAV